jgi:glycosyltransferase involved in cell wall biosynthesis
MEIVQIYPTPVQKQAISCQSAVSTLIAIPVFNEFKYVNDVLNEVHKYSDNILVVDDGSTDGTSKELEQHSYIKIISHKENQGYGQSLLDAFNFASPLGAGCHKFDWLITLDCDCQHEPLYIPNFYCEIEKDDADIISGSRYLPRSDSGSLPPPRDRVAINKKITRILNRFMAVRLTDSFCGFKAYKVDAISKLGLTEKGYGFPLQLWIRANRAKLRIREIPVTLIYHDPQRNFGGKFEKPEVRFDYYMQIIRREIRHNVDKNAAVHRTPYGGT